MADVSHDPEQGDATQVDAAQAALGDGDTARAERLLREVAANAPEAWRARWREGDTVYGRFWDLPEFLFYSAVHQADEAMKGVDLVWLPCAYPRAFYYLAFLRVEAGDAAGAAEHLQRALALEPDHPLLLCEMGLICGSLGDHEGAVRWYEQALTARPAMPDALRAQALRGRGVQLIDLERLDEAEANLRESLQYDAASQVAHSELAYITQLRAGRGPAPIELTRTAGPGTEADKDPKQKRPWWRKLGG